MLEIKSNLQQFEEEYILPSLEKEQTAAIQQTAEATTSCLDVLGDENGTKELVAEHTLRKTYPERLHHYLNLTRLFF